MTYFSTIKLRIAGTALVLATSAMATTASAQGLGIPIMPNLDFPQEGAFESKSGKCFLLICSAKPQVTQDAADIATKVGEKS
ncbi:hypothetical protein C8N43_3456 [Litoreibacter ponti]|uniref:Uncharacterized protein n=1 Tax=Litoreibacter ponti TaxID=1510457 RepID=A0A2T6BF15_9RHOB|nr:hypothetical protein [Litoreibacter ponti]PTX54639.1 hypothetical protein C8N43_3456 [Litoreibacter ponti]